MFYVYIIKSDKNGSLYIGYAPDLRIRLEKHNKGLVQSTSRYLPWELVYYEAFKDQYLALSREKNLKYFGKAYGQLKRRVGL